MNLERRMTMSLFILLKIVVIVLLLTATTFAHNGETERASRCNAAPTDPISYVPLPGHPFSTISSKDGCWLFVSVTSSNPNSANGVAMLSRMDGRIVLKKVFPIEAGPTGMVMTHDGKLLIVADDDYVVFLDVIRMTAVSGEPILG